MKRKPSARGHDTTRRYISGELDDNDVDPVQRFNKRTRHQQENKTQATSLRRADEATASSDLHTLPSGTVLQVYSRFCDVEHEKAIWRCVARKTLTSTVGGDIAVGDIVRFRDMKALDESGLPQAVIEQVMPRATLLTRADSFKQLTSHPIVANAEQMLIVAAVAQPEVKWGLVDRMLIAARGGNLTPIIVLNKSDLLGDDKNSNAIRAAADHYRSLGIDVLRTSTLQNENIDALRELLVGRSTVLAGHSGVGKSSLIRAVDPALDLRVGDVNTYTGKGRHTTTAARRFPLTGGGYVFDTPGVRVFGLWGVTPDNLVSFFPDVEADTAPAWRMKSYQRILSAMNGENMDEYEPKSE